MALLSSALTSAQARDAGAPADLRATSKPPARSRFFPKLIDKPGILSERVRAQLAERAAAAKGAAAAEARQTTLPEAAVLTPAAPRNGPPMRRMISFETVEGVTVLSNRSANTAEPPQRPVADSITAEPPAPRAAAPSSKSEEERAPRTEAARPLRPAEEPDTRWPWLLLFGTGGAAIGVWVAMRGRGTAQR